MCVRCRAYCRFLTMLVDVAELYKSAKEYANLANRSRPITTDLICVCDDRGIRTADLRRAAARRPKKRRKGTRAFLSCGRSW
jgi:hypothetical protein